MPRLRGGEGLVCKGLGTHRADRHLCFCFIFIIYLKPHIWEISSVLAFIYFLQYRECPTGAGAFAPSVPMEAHSRPTCGRQDGC